MFVASGVEVAGITAISVALGEVVGVLGTLGVREGGLVGVLLASTAAVTTAAVVAPGTAVLVWVGGTGVDVAETDGVEVRVVVPVDVTVRV